MTIGIPRGRSAVRSLAALLGVLLVVACSDDDGDAADVTPTTSTTERHASSTTEALDPVIGATGVGDGYYPGLGNGGYDVGRYVLALDVDPEAGTIDATATIEATATEDLEGFHLDLIGLDVGEVTVDDDPAETSRDGQELRVELREPIAAGDAFVVVVPYSGEPQPVDTPSLGPVGWTPLAGGGSYVLSEPEGAATWFPANDHPSDKALFRFEITTPDGIEAAANGLLVSSDPTPDGRTRWIYETAHPMATYLATVGIGDLVFEESTGPNGLPMRNVYDADVAAEAAPAFARQPEMIDFFDDLFGPYPFEVYGVLVMDVSLGVALENQTMSFFGSDIAEGGDFAQEIVAHELAHQWYGDSVALERWEDIWLNEGFATYAQWLWVEHAVGEPIGERARRTHQQLDRSGFGDLPPGDPGPGALFAASVYERGALTLHALRQAVGDDAFFIILRRWATENADGNVDTEQFVALAEEVGGTQLDELFDEWLYAEGLPPLAG